MSTHFIGQGNIGSNPEYREFPNGNNEPRRLLRLNVYFDNPIPTGDGEFEDQGGFWAPVEIWHREVEHWQTLYHKCMRVLVEGRMVREEWEDAEGKLQEQGLLMRHGTIMNATIIAAPSSAKNRAGARDPEMHQTKKGN